MATNDDREKLPKLSEEEMKQIIQQMLYTNPTQLPMMLLTMEFLKVTSIMLTRLMEKWGVTTQQLEKWIDDKLKE